MRKVMDWLLGLRKVSGLEDGVWSVKFSFNI